MTTLPPPDDRVSAYLDGELDATERRDVEALLGESADWRDALAQVASVRDAVRTMPLRDAPPGFWEGLLADRAGPAVATPTRRRTPVVRGVAVAAAVAAAGVAALVVPTATTTEERRTEEREAFRAGDDQGGITEEEDEDEDRDQGEDTGRAEEEDEDTEPAEDSDGAEDEDEDADSAVEEVADQALRMFVW